MKIGILSFCVRVHVYSIRGGIIVRLWVIVALKLAFGVPSMRQYSDVAVKGVNYDKALVLCVIGYRSAGRIILICFSQFDLENTRSDNLLAIYILLYRQ